VLTPFQKRIASIVASLPEAEGFALAGGAALIELGLTNRSTRDLDFFAIPGQEKALAALRDALEGVLGSEGLVVRLVRDHPGFVRIEVSDGDDRCEIDLATDYRLLEPNPSTLGPTLVAEELAANKVLAVFDRAYPRDFIDLVALSRRFELHAMIDLATEKDPGFDLVRFLEALSSFDRFTADDFGLSDSDYADLRSTVDAWRSQLGRELRREPPEQGSGLER
jgi:hypothetical protein